MHTIPWRFTAALMLALTLHALPAAADPLAPWGSAPELDHTYSKQKVLFDARTGSLEALTSLLDRASYISVLNGADPFDSKIVIVLHGGTIPFFGIKNYQKYRELMQRAQSLTVGGIIEFRMCKLAAKGQGYNPKDIHGFVSMVPMGDAEIVKLQQEGFAYMH